MSYTENLAVVINALIEQKANELVARREGKPVPGGVGSSLGGTSVSTDGVIDKGENDNNNGDDEEKEKLKDKLEPGDEPEKFKLFDCESGEEVTIDGLGGGGAGPSYPTGFENCKKSNNCDGVPPSTLVWVIKNTAGTQSFYSFTPSGACYAAGGIDFISSDNSCLLPADGGNYYRPVGQTTLSSLTQSERDQLCGGNWPAPDKNHLVWNKDKNCMEPLCPDLNNQVAAKYKGCNEEMVLCDEDGNKVKVTIDGDEMKVLQTKFNQEATVKNGKVQSTKPLTPEQVARAMKG